VLVLTNLELRNSAWSGALRRIRPQQSYGSALKDSPMIWAAFGNPERFLGGDTPSMIVLPMFRDDPSDDPLGSFVARIGRRHALQS
jgi:hypothetical protein